MSEINDGGPAFPGVDEQGDPYNGMTLHAYFAAKAMQGICAHPDTWGLSVEEIAIQAYALATQMMKEMAK